MKKKAFVAITVTWIIAFVFAFSIAHGQNRDVRRTGSPSSIVTPSNTTPSIKGPTTSPYIDGPQTPPPTSETILDTTNDGVKEIETQPTDGKAWVSGKMVGWLVVAVVGLVIVNLLYFGRKKTVV